MSSNHPAAGLRGAAVRPAAPRGPGEQTVNADGHRLLQAPSPDAASDEYAGTSLRLQVLEIIDSLLNSTAPELEAHRARLRDHVTEHPWDPETALLQYLRDREQHLATPPQMPGDGL